MRLTVLQSSAGLERAALHPAPAGGDEALGDVALAPAVMGGVDGEAERRVAVGDGALDVIVDPGLVAAHIELVEPQRIGRRPPPGPRAPDRRPS